MRHSRQLIGDPFQQHCRSYGSLHHLHVVLYVVGQGPATRAAAIANGKTNAWKSRGKSSTTAVEKECQQLDIMIAHQCVHVVLYAQVVGSRYADMKHTYHGSGQAH